MKFIYFVLFVLFLSSCKSPSELLEAGNYNLAFDKAVKELKKGKDIEQNTKVIKVSAKKQVASAMQYATIKSGSGDVKAWIKTQTKLYEFLEKLGKANTQLEGIINEPYDEVCSMKKDIDFQIVEYYYNEGHDFLDDFYNLGQKVDAREAYYSFTKCEKHEGQSFFLNLSEDKEDAYHNGIVYYVSNYGGINNSLFLKELSSNADIKPDCDISINHGFVSTSTSESTSRNEHSKRIQIGQESVTDTSGVVTFNPIWEEVKATVITKTITMTARVSTQIRSNNITGQCTVQSTSFNTEVSDSYDEVSVDGDSRALTHHVDTKNGAPAFFKSSLEKDVVRKADRKISI